MKNKTKRQINQYVTGGNFYYWVHNTTNNEYINSTGGGDIE